MCWPSVHVNRPLLFSTAICASQKGMNKTLALRSKKAFLYFGVVLWPTLLSLSSETTRPSK